MRVRRRDENRGFARNLGPVVNVRARVERRRNTRQITPSVGVIRRIELRRLARDLGPRVSVGRRRELCRSALDVGPLQRHSLHNEPTVAPLTPGPCVDARPVKADEQRPDASVGDLVDRVRFESRRIIWTPRADDLDAGLAPGERVGHNIQHVVPAQRDLQRGIGGVRRVALHDRERVRVRVQVDCALGHDDGVAVLRPQDDRVVVRTGRAVELSGLEGERTLAGLRGENQRFRVDQLVRGVEEVFVVLLTLHDEAEGAAGQVEREAISVEKNAAEAVGLPPFEIESHLLPRRVRQLGHGYSPSVQNRVDPYITCRTLSAPA